MRKVFLDDLPRWEGKNHNGKINWKESVGYKVNFVYDDVNGELKITYYDNKKERIKVKYLNVEYDIAIRSFMYCHISNVLGLIDHTCYNVGDIVELQNTNIKILDVYRDTSHKRKYRCKCLQCSYEWDIDNRTIRDKCKCTKCSKNAFRLSEDGLYWIGVTQNNVEFWFDGNKEIIEYVKSHTWRETFYGYFQNRVGEKLHRIIMSVNDNNIYINHLGGDKFDNRIQNLSISNCLDNSREKQLSSRNNSGIVGLMKRGRKCEKWVGSIKINNICIYTKYKTKDEALIDLLIVQRHYGFRHNMHLYHLLENISGERINDVLQNINRQLNKKSNNKIIGSNTYKLSKCGNYYNVVDKNNKMFKIDINNKSLVEEGLWYVAIDKKHKKPYVHGAIIINGVRKCVKLHRFLFGLLDVKYKNIFVDHINGDGLDNRICNLELTNASGNGKNKPAKGYSMRNGKARAGITINGKRTTKTFVNIKDAEEWYNKQKQISLNNRLTFNSKEAIDKYLHEQEWSNES